MTEIQDRQGKDLPLPPVINPGNLLPCSRVTATSLDGFKRKSIGGGQVNQLLGAMKAKWNLPGL